MHFKKLWEGSSPNLASDTTYLLFSLKLSKKNYAFLMKTLEPDESNKNTRTKCEICSKSTVKTPERCQWHCSGVFIVNFQHI